MDGNNLQESERKKKWLQDNDGEMERKEQKKKVEIKIFSNCFLITVHFCPPSNSTMLNHKKSYYFLFFLSPLILKLALYAL